MLQHCAVLSAAVYTCRYTPRDSVNKRKVVDTGNMKLMQFCNEQIRNKHAFKRLVTSRAHVYGSSLLPKL